MIKKRSRKALLLAAIMASLGVGAVPPMGSVQATNYTSMQTIRADHTFNDGDQIKVDSNMMSIGIAIRPGSNVKTINIGNDGKGTLHINTATTDSGYSDAIGVTPYSGANAVINGNLDIKAYSGGWFSNGIAVQNLSKGKGAETHLTINGNVNIGDPAKVSSLTDSVSSRDFGVNSGDIHGGYEGDTGYTGARWAPAAIGIVGNSNHSTMDFNGNLFASARGNVLVSDPYYKVNGMADEDLAVVNINKGNVQLFTPESTENSFYSVMNMGGTININMNDAKTDSANVGHDVSIQGNIITMKDPGGKTGGGDYFYRSGRTNLALDTANSKWKGVVDNSGLSNVGETNLWLKNHAVWEHVATSRTNGMDAEKTPSPSNGHYGLYDGNSHISNLHGGSYESTAGFILQGDTQINIENYDGHTTVAYQHSGTTINGGDVKINNAASNSGIGIVTNSKDLNLNDSGTINTVLSNLARKLFYNSWSDGNLTGKVGITEGLTSSSKYLKQGAIKFTQAQGFYDPGAIPVDPTPVDPDPEPTYMTGPITDSENIGTTRKAVADGSVTITGTEPNTDRVVSAMYPASSHGKQDPMIVDLQGHDLTLNAESDADLRRVASAIDMEGSNHAQIKNTGDAATLTIYAFNAATQGANGIYMKGGYSSLTIDAPVAIKDISTKGDSANGIAMQGQNTSVTIHGPLTISNVYGERARGRGVNVDGIGATADNSSVTVDGIVDISGVLGSSLRTTGKNSLITVGGGRITAAPDMDKSHNYCAARVDKGTININMTGDNQDQPGSNTTNITGDMYVTGQHGKRVVEYSGGELVNWNDSGKLNVALTNKDSSWTGMASYDQYEDNYGSGGGNTVHDIGQLNLYLQNGATWTNEQQSHLTTTTVEDAQYTGSELGSLHGGSSAGIIFQNDFRPILVNQYSGDTKVFYKHDESNPSSIIGGDFKITNADKGAKITLFTDSKGLSSGFSDSDADDVQDRVSDVLDKLANKLYYTNYTDNHLKGQVEIVEGLTSSSKSLKLGNITFSTDTTGTKKAGQGFYHYTKHLPQTPITGVLADDKYYVNKGITSDGQKYTFNNDATLNVIPAIDVSVAGHAVDVEAKGHTLGINVQKDRYLTVDGINVQSADDVTINADKLTINAENHKGRVEGIRVGGQTAQDKDKPVKLTINGDTDLKVRGKGYALGLYTAGNADVTFNGNVTSLGDDKSEWGITSTGGGYANYGVALVYSGSNYGLQQGPRVTINGDVNAKIDGNALFTNGGNAKLAINGGGDIEVNKDNTRNYYAMLAQSGTTSMNVNIDADDNATSARDNNLTLKGNIAAGTGAIHDNEPEQYTNVNLGLATNKSEWTGVAHNQFNDEGNAADKGKTFYGAINLWLQNGAAWNNEKWGAISDDVWSGNSFTESHLAKLVGGESHANAGIIHQNDANPIRVDNYSGNTKVFYQHDIVDNTTRDNADKYGNKEATVTGGDFKITKAAEKSNIILITDNKGVNSISTGYQDQNLSNDLLNKLANKLYYLGYASHLTAKVEIADGLTVSSKYMKLGDISFSTDTTGTKTAGQGYYDYDLVIPDAQTTDSYTSPITGDCKVDTSYVSTGVLKEGSHNYIFTKSSTTINTKNVQIKSGITTISASISGIGDKKPSPNINLNGNDLTITNTDARYYIYGIAAVDRGTVNIENAGKISIDTVNDTTNFSTGGIYADNYGKVTIHNGGVNADDKVLTVRAQGKRKENVHGISAHGYGAAVTVDGLVDILADLNNGSEGAIKAVAAAVDVGGGSIKGANGAYAVRAYKGGYKNYNNALVNINTAKDEDGNLTGAGTLKTNIEGDISLGDPSDGTPGGQVNLGLNTRDSSFTGNIVSAADANDGNVTLYMGNGAAWTGNNQSSATVIAHMGSGTSWTGYSTGNNMNLDMNADDAVWNNTGESKFASLTGTAGIIDMTGENAGAVTVDNYNGNVTIVYNHEITDNNTRDNAEAYNNKEATVSGADFNITNAADGSTITLMTDSKDVNTTSNDYRDQNLANDLLDKLANKLHYAAYTDNHLKGQVKIAEGLTASSKSLKIGDITFSRAHTGTSNAGRGYYDYKMVYPDTQTTDPMNKTIDGSTASENAYKNAGIYKDDTNTYDFTVNPATINGDSGSAVNGSTKDLSLKGETISLNGGTDGTGVIADSKAVTIDSNANITGKTGISASNGGQVTITGTSNITATGDAVNASGENTTVSLKDGSIRGDVNALDNASVTTNGANLSSDATASNGGSIALTNGSAVNAAADGAGSTLTTNGTTVSGTISAANGANTTVTNGTAANATASGAGSTLTTTGTNISSIISAANGDTAVMNNGTAAGLSAEAGSTVTANLNEANARLNGNVANEGTAAVNLSNGAQWTGNSTGTGTTTATIASGSTWTGASTNGNTSVDLAGTWKQTGASTIATLTGGNGTLDKSDANSGETNIAHYSGHITAAYDHDEANPTHITGGGITIGEADTGSSINLITSSKGLNMGRRANARNQVSETLNQLAHKLTYTGSDGNLTGRVGISSGLTSSSASLRAENLTFDSDGTASFVYTPVIDTLDIEYGSEETQMMRGTKSALLGSALLWRNNNNDLMRRMGDIRLGRQDTGIWAKYQGQKVSFDGQNADLDGTYNGVQVGIDKNVNGWLVGAAFDYGKGKVDYKGGRGDDKMGTGAIYGSRQFSDGSYFDAIAKVGRVGNDFHVTNEVGDRLTGNYHSWGESLSVEYGKRFRFDNGFFLTPNVEFTMGHLASKTFTGKSDLGTMRIKQHGFNSAIGRIGVGFGWERPNSTLFAKFDVAHEFGGNFRTDYYADDGGAKSTHVDLSDTWLDMELGGSVNVGKDTYLYGTYTRSFGADAQTKWRADVGIRYTF